MSQSIGRTITFRSFIFFPNFNLLNDKKILEIGEIILTMFYHRNRSKCLVKALDDDCVLRCYYEFLLSRSAATGSFETSNLWKRPNHG